MTQAKAPTHKAIRGGFFSWIMSDFSGIRRQLYNLGGRILARYYNLRWKLLRR